MEKPLNRIRVAKLEIANDRPIVVIAGPCVIESQEHALMMSSRLKEICDKLQVGLVYKSSFDKANRTSGSSYRGVGFDKGLEILNKVKLETNIPVLTDVHESQQCSKISEVADILQIPAFLCRQTDLLTAAAETSKAINVKKGQFLAPWDVENIVAKINDAGNKNVMVCERGASFGYNTLVTDFRGIPLMAKMTGCPIVFDATHSVQQPGGQGTSSGGQSEYAPVLARAAVAVGVAAVFVETHQDPDNAPSDGPNMIPLSKIYNVIKTLKTFDQIAKENPVQIGVDNITG